MDFKVLITNSGEESLFTTLSTELERRLPKAAVEWKRSYGRPPKSVILQASFCKFDSNRLSSSLDPNLQTKPLLHIFWTSCLDNDYFKSTVRNSILKWQKELIQHRCSDWLIIHVVKQENVRSGKSKIQLPRSSVYDKIKLEFCQKLQERCLQLWEPDKSTLFTKSGESWDMLLVQLRRLLINSFGNYLDLFEEKIRVAREKYADPDWSFIEYFIAHEELALIYQSITLKEDALVQYDEVDALLSQFVINCKGKEPPNWLQALCFTPTSWDGVTLSSTVCTHYRDLIKSGKASLLDFRNYLFSRQCKLLIKMKRSWDIPLRLTDFLFAMIHELGFLKISMDSGMISCWIILTCMQLFQVLEATENKDRVFSTCMANLYYYLFSKLYVIGQLTGLYYYRKQTEVEIVNVNNLLTGIGKHHVSKKDTYSFSKSLKSALQSQSKFGELFIQIASKSMESFKELNYKHFTVRVGVQLANYYLEHEQYLDADSLLQEAQNIYKNQKWEVLHNDILIPLAHCQSKLKSYKQYLKSVCVLACSPYLSLSKKLHYNEELIRLMSENNLGCISTEPLIKIKKIRIPLVKGKGHIGDYISARTSFTQNTLVKRIKEHRRTWSRNKNIPDLNDTDGPAVSKVLSSSVKSSSESLENIKRSGSSLERTNSFVYNKLPEEQFVTENLTSSRESISKSASNGSIFTYDEVLDASDLTTKSSAIQDKQQTITDVSNSGKSSIDLSVTSKDSNSSLNVLQNENEKNQEIKINDFILTFGTNDLVFSTKINFEGRFILSHIEFYVSNAVFTHKLKLPNEHSFSMVIEPPKIEWTSNYIVDSLLTGSKERLYVTMLNGPGIVIENSVLNIFSNSGLVFYGMNETDACIYPLENNQLPRHAVISVTTNENKEAALILPHCLPYERINICFDVVAPLENDGKTNIQHEEKEWVSRGVWF
uniref:Trafficking protein particle complex subunit 10 n=1 Tax=Hydra vulgaris TaxID=6087 RepID=T2MG50_HYDVU